MEKITPTGYTEVDLNSIKLTSGDEKMLTLFLLSKNHLETAGFAITLDLPNKHFVSFAKRKGKGNTIKLFMKEETYYLRTKRVSSGEIIFEELKLETADFMLKWIAFIEKVTECIKLKREIARISSQKKKRNGHFHIGKMKNPTFVKMMEELKKSKIEQASYVKTQQYEQAATMRDAIREQSDAIMTYLLATYSKRKILTSKYLPELLFGETLDFIITPLY